MTTAHRPTWNSARGSEQGGNNLVLPKRNYSALDMPSHLKLKDRSDGQGSISDLTQKDFKEELLRKERELERKKLGLPPLSAEDE